MVGVVVVVFMAVVVMSVVVMAVGKARVARLGVSEGGRGTRVVLSWAAAPRSSSMGKEGGIWCAEVCCAPLYCVLCTMVATEGFSSQLASIDD